MRFVRFFLGTLLTAIAALLLVDLGVRAGFPLLPRFEDSFSAAYLTRAIAKGIAGRTVFLGDSVLWGYGLPAQDAAGTLLDQRGYPIANFSFEGGSMVNTYAMLRLLQARDARPARVVFNINVKEFNVADSAYNTLYPGLETLAWPLLSPAERALLVQTQKATLDARMDRALARVWLLYGMRSDIREELFDQPDAASAVQDEIETISGTKARSAAAHRPTADKFLGTYDLTPLSATNVEVIFLRKTIALLHAWHVPAIAILTPTNHALLHDYIDVPDYQSQLAYLRKLCGTGVRVLDLDRAFAADEFLDNDHLTAGGNQRFAVMLEPYLR